MAPRDLPKTSLRIPTIQIEQKATDNIVKDKLLNPIINVQGASDQSIGAINNKDPYHEKIE